MTARTEIAEAFSTVDGVNCSATPRVSNKPGDASVRIGRKEAAANGFGYVTYYQVVIAIPQDLAAGDKWIEDHHDAIAAATRRVWVPTTVTPAEVVFPDGGATNAVIYEGTR